MSLPPAEQIASEICNFVDSLVGQRCSATDDLRALGVDSIAFLELVIFIEKRFKVPLPLDLITSHALSTPALLTQHLLALTAEDTPS